MSRPHCTPRGSRRAAAAAAAPNRHKTARRVQQSSATRPRAQPQLLTCTDMKTIQIINLDGKPAAIAVNGIAHVAEDVPANQLQHVQAKALYALMVQTGDVAGPYTDTGAEDYAQRAANVRAALTARLRARRVRAQQPGRRRSAGHHRRRREV